MSGARAGRVAIAVLIAASVLAVFWPVLDFGFLTYDDDLYVTENRQVENGLSLGGLAWACTTFHAANWHPLTWLSHMLDVELYGAAARGHHATSLLLHLASALLLFAALAAMTGATGRSGFVAALFAVHPLHVESVAWVAERKDVLAGLFFALALLAYTRYARAPGIASYLGVFAIFALGLSAKPTLVTFPLVLLLLDFWPLGRWKARSGRLVLEKLPLLALSAAASVLTLAAQAHGQALAPLREHSFASRLSNALVAYVAYLGESLWPRALAVFYPHPGSALPIWRTLAAGAALGLITALSLGQWRRRPYLSVGWLWYLGMLVPMIGLVQVGSQAMADRYTYLPLVGIFVSVAWGGKELLDALKLPRSRVWAPTLAALVVALLALQARAQVRFWRDSVTLLEHALEVEGDRPGAEIVHYQLASALESRGDAAGALEHYERALALDARYAEAHAALAHLLATQGRAKDALPHYEAALRINPDFAQAHNNLANLLVASGRASEALVHYGAALRIDPAYVAAHVNLGIVLTAQDRPEAAIAHFLEALRIEPDSVQAHYGLGAARAARREWVAAAEQFSSVVRLEPDHAKGHVGLATARFFLGDYRAAWDEVLRARQLGLEPPAAFLSMLEEKMPQAANGS